MQKKKRQHSVNYKKARVGLQILAGDTRSQREKLVEAGYALSSAKAPKNNGIDSDRCVEEALKLDLKGDPATILRLARECLQEKLQSSSMMEERSPEIARTLDIAEKWFGDREVAPKPGRSTVNITRIQSVQLVLIEARERGLIALDPRLDGRVIEAETVTHGTVSHGEDAEHAETEDFDDVAEF